MQVISQFMSYLSTKENLELLQLEQVSEHKLNYIIKSEKANKI